MHKPSRRTKDDTGASTLELTAVVSVLGGVSALAVVTLSPLSRDAVDVACQATQQTVRMAASAFETQSPTGSFAPDMATLVAGGYLHSTLPDVAYTVTITGTGTSFDVRGTGPCAT